MNKKKKKPKIITASPYAPIISIEEMNRIRREYQACTFEERQKILEDIFPGGFVKDGRYVIPGEILAKHLPDLDVKKVKEFIAYMFGVYEEDEITILQ